MESTARVSYKLEDNEDLDPQELNDQALQRISQNHEELLEFVELCSKFAQKSWIYDLSETLRLTRLQGKAEYMLQYVVEDNFLADPAGHSYGAVSCDFQVKETTLSHDYDLKALKSRVVEMFEWYENEEIRQKFLSPYFPLIQSSGMGKTKLLYELKQYFTLDDKSYHVVLVLCSSGELEGDMSQTYNEAVEMEECMKREPDPKMKYREVEKELEQLCKRHNNKPTVLLFDEAQNILVGKDNHLFNCIQWWLAKKNKQPLKVVAVFAGSTLQFAHIEREPPESKHWGEYWMDGSERYPPFFQLHTMGCLLKKHRQNKADNTEFDESVAYGRPLFAKMGERRLLHDESQVDILKRLVLSHEEDWRKRADSCFSVLATRVQMGQTSFNIASELVSRGYAVLQNLDMEQRVAEICHLPDPVCARLAMCLMKEDYTTAGAPDLHGYNRKFWADKMAEIFSEQTCVPSAGDVGEVFCALYLLFCGDILRFQNKDDKECKHFSVSLCNWIHLLIAGGGPGRTNAGGEGEDGEHNEEDEGGNDEQDQATTPRDGDFVFEPPAQTIDASVCFIQLTQNYLRFNESMHAWTQQHFLEHLYKSRSAFYVFEDCSVFDIFGSIRINSSTPTYVPLLISVVNLPKFSPSEATSSCCAMEMMLTKARCYGGLCILLVLGRTVHSEFDEELVLTNEDLELIPNEIVAKVIEIPTDDAFGLTKKFWSVTSSDTEFSEVFGSHSFLAWHQEDDIESAEFLRRGKRTENANGSDHPLHYLNELRRAVGFTPPKGS
ncbi:expressed unknown protein [Seminavis robusta]|uniref:Uncharacterized protein n=1 Tax=Seminavis robusta TaxID=568900 RepID=A0A9N8HA17_9STRA|nr:expressed unknown protein [Seminavis robusta]|eukprot:Sro226_g092040.1 n/a (778) ;mRNA; r:41609-43942